MIELRLTGMRETYAIRAKQTWEQNLANEDFFGLMMQDEIEFRRGAKIKRLLRVAALRCSASLEEIDTKIDRGLDKKQLKEPATCRFIDDGLNILVLGPTGVGKTHTRYRKRCMPARIQHCLLQNEYTNRAAPFSTGWPAPDELHTWVQFR